MVVDTTGLGGVGSCLFPSICVLVVSMGAELCETTPFDLQLTSQVPSLTSHDLPLTSCDIPLTSMISYDFFIFGPSFFFLFFSSKFHS